MTQDHQAPPLPPPPPQQQKDKDIVMEEPKVEKNWPVWLEPFLQTNFFVFCAHHSLDCHKMECNMYCLDCNNGNALCALCLINHSTHHILQIRKSSYQNVIRVTEIQKVLDVSGVQTYVINSARVFFLNERPQLRVSRNISITCLFCDRSLLNDFLYCSIACKFKVESKQLMKKVGSSNVAIAPRPPLIRRPSTSNNPQEKEKRSVKSNAAEAGPASFRPPSRRRKGIPRRAPFGVLSV
ncbi:PLATZ transcription factor protein [Dioscorea alata]|uniref:PLATZ transcription factor protein n=1 Tax=Dioscorea alata TaxID=55571 RepID=A0ACB7UFN8_DIOAL|nr:PLATZ transcription factor protein [Dioscorea alata]